MSPEDADEDQNKIYKESLSRAAVPEWACWRTGVELSCFGVKLLRVCQLKPDELFFGHDGLYHFYVCLNKYGMLKHKEEENM